MMQMVWPLVTLSPSFTNDGSPGAGARYRVPAMGDATCSAQDPSTGILTPCLYLELALLSVPHLCVLLSGLTHVKTAEVIATFKVLRAMMSQDKGDGADLQYCFCYAVELCLIKLGRFGHISLLQLTQAQ